MSRLEAGPRHAAKPQRAGRITVAIAHGIAWVLTDHDDRIPNLVQGVVWFVGLVVLFVCIGLQ